MSNISFSAVPAAANALTTHGQVSNLPAKTIDCPLPKGINNPTPAELISSVDSAPSTPTPVEAPKAAPEAVVPPEQVFAQKEARYKQELAKLEQAYTALKAEAEGLSELKGFKEKLANKDYSELAQLVNYEEYTNYLIDQAGSADPAKAELNALKSEVAALKDNQKSEIDKLFDRVVSERRAEVKQLVETDPNLSTIKSRKEEEAVVQHILDTYESDGIELTVAQAAQEVEAALFEIAQTWTSVPKLAQTATAKEAPAPVKVAPKVTTLTNSMQAAGEIKRISKPLYEISNTADRIREARIRAAEKLAQRQGVK